MSSGTAQEKNPDRAAFLAHLEWASQEVSRWPAWKREVLGRIEAQPAASKPTTPAERSSAPGDPE
jgi:hypothetical protein